MTTANPNATVGGPTVTPLGVTPDKPAPIADTRGPLPIRVPGTPIRVKANAVTEASRETRRPYWIGLCKGAPFEFVTAGGVDFCTATGNRLDGRGNPIAPQQYGRIAAISDTHLALILQRLDEKIVRVRRTGAQVHSRKKHTFAPRVGDAPMLCFVYIVPGSDETLTLAERKRTPAPVAELPTAAAENLAEWQERVAKQRQDEKEKPAPGASPAEYTEDWSSIAVAR